MPKHFSRPHIGKVPMRFYFCAQDISVALPGLDIRGNISLVWKRGYRRTSTEPFVVKEELSPIDGSLTRTATTMQDLAQICTMFKNTRTSSFESKVATFTLRSEEKKLASATIDLSSYATPEMSAEPVELSLLDGNVVIKFTLASHWLKNMPQGGDDDDDAASMQSFGSCTDVDDDDSSLSDRMHAISTLPKYPKQLALRHGGGSSIPGPAADSSSYSPMDANDKLKSKEGAEAAIEAQWEAAEGRVRDAQEAGALREELEDIKGQLRHARKDSKYLRERMEQLAAENRVLRRDPRKGKRDAVIEQLEVELQRKEQERADMEESLSNAFSAVIKELQARVTGLTAERDRLLVAVAEASGRKGGFLTAKQ
uniref:C2 NT-type domain-containing protein n=1 Tax=Coccolithus braarudii TaxID=221442 RepID=A0A7S0Q9C0_9EUKA